MLLERDMSHLTRLFPRPQEDEEIPIQLIDIQEKFAGWSPALKRSVYVDDYMETDGLKRVREVSLLKVYNWLLDGESFIELSDMERQQFENIMDIFIKYGGEVRYTRKKVAGRLTNYFRLERGSDPRAKIKEKMLADKL
ncbi:hypothetical protein V7O66_06275 [Methanolobus sp. ZRKC3]|uniref:hypothetical protein n=1 Tax=Methanolobus sp. ZRKC3 TaxID=3125786 RepID=UPI003244C928